MFLQNYKRALEVLIKKPIMLWALSLLLGILTIVGSLVTLSIPFLSMAVAYLFTCGGTKLYLDGLKGKNVNSKQLFAAFNRNCIKTAGAMAWQALWTLIWAGVPIAGIVKSYSYRFVPYIVMSHPEISAFDALKISMKMTKGKKMQMWLADILFVIGCGVIGLILGLLSGIPLIGSIFSLVAFLFVLAVALFSSIFVGLYQAAFFNEDDVAKFAAEVAAAEAGEPVAAE